MPDLHRMMHGQASSLSEAALFCRVVPHLALELIFKLSHRKTSRWIRNGLHTRLFEEWAAKMDWELVKTVVAIAAVLIAIVSLAFNGYQYRQNRNFRPVVVKKDEIRNALNDLITKLDSSQIVTIQPHYEHWIYGFTSLEELRAICAAANTLVENSALPPQHVKTITSTMLEKVKAVLYYRDSLSHLKKGRDYLSPADYEKWKHKADAENTLHDLQRFLTARDQALRDYVRELNA
jgi:hypothetical protein